MQRPRRPNRQSRRGNQHQSNTTFSSSSSAPQSHSHPWPNPRSFAPRSYPSSVPPYSALHVGTPVSIILKADQATGHQVTGLVAEPLTRGDHPRGVKVRLRDGRVGRVQRLASEEEGVDGESRAGGAEAGLGRNGESGGSEFGSRGGRGRGGGRGNGNGRGGGGFQHVADVRDDPYMYDEEGAQSRSLGVYFKGLELLDAKDEEEKMKKGVNQNQDDAEIAYCPVCHTFSGDERAVAHHVESHFTD
ncbi:hypothetical protein K491DRAFT_704157 [Lophiostoma macrostomum CBS 122681]|uniref:UBZ4-type domain-containing protein n=1 Tax=Lophiostoma macrostomum CBS 122681 TaxID=1314788 RepID=A0A6A6TB93_9PLEO|nr:hypothetical protein K491DRAFT_704157 [Lophiostoma macrostomum CBS 122681]